MASCWLLLELKEEKFYPGPSLNRRPRWSRGSYTRHWIRGSWVQTRWIFSERKNPEYDFLRKGRKAVRPLS